MMVQTISITCLVCIADTTHWKFALPTTECTDVTWAKVAGKPDLDVVATMGHQQLALAEDFALSS